MSSDSSDFQLYEPDETPPARPDGAEQQTQRDWEVSKHAKAQKRKERKANHDKALADLTDELTTARLFLIEPDPEG